MSTSKFKYYFEIKNTFEMCSTFEELENPYEMIQSYKEKYPKDKIIKHLFQMYEIAILRLCGNN